MELPKGLSQRNGTKASLGAKAEKLQWKKGNYTSKHPKPRHINPKDKGRVAKATASINAESATVHSSRLLRRHSYWHNDGTVAYCKFVPVQADRTALKDLLARLCLDHVHYVNVHRSLIPSFVQNLAAKGSKFFTASRPRCVQHALISTVGPTVMLFPM